MPRMHAATGNQPLGILFAVIHHPAVYFRSESHHLGSYVINKDGTIDAHRIQIFQQRLRRFAVFNNVFKTAAGPLHDLNRASLEHVVGLDVDVTVGDHHVFSEIPRAARNPYSIETLVVEHKLLLPVHRSPGDELLFMVRCKDRASSPALRDRDSVISRRQYRPLGKHAYDLSSIFWGECGSREGLRQLGSEFADHGGYVLIDF